MAQQKDDFEEWSDSYSPQRMPWDEVTNDVIELRRLMWKLQDEISDVSIQIAELRSEVQSAKNSTATRVEAACGQLMWGLVAVAVLVLLLGWKAF